MENKKLSTDAMISIVELFKKAIYSGNLERIQKIADDAVIFEGPHIIEQLLSSLVTIPEADDIPIFDLLALTNTLSSRLGITLQTNLLTSIFKKGKNDKWMAVAKRLIYNGHNITHRAVPTELSVIEYLVVERRWDEALTLLELSRSIESRFTHDETSVYKKIALHLTAINDSAALDLMIELLQIKDINISNTSIESLICAKEVVEALITRMDDYGEMDKFVFTMNNASLSKKLEILQQLISKIELMPKQTTPYSLLSLLNCAIKYAKNAILFQIAINPDSNVDDEKIQSALAFRREDGVMEWLVRNTTSTTIYHGLKRRDPKAIEKLNKEIFNNKRQVYYHSNVQRDLLTPVIAIAVESTSVWATLLPDETAKTDSNNNVALLNNALPSRFIPSAAMNKLAPVNATLTNTVKKCTTAHSKTTTVFAPQSHPQSLDFKEEICNCTTAREIMTLVKKLKKSQQNELNGLLKLAKNKLLSFALEGAIDEFDTETLEFIKERRIKGIRGGFFQTTSDKILGLVRKRKDKEALKLLNKEVESNKTEFKRSSPSIDKFANYIADWVSDCGTRDSIITSIGVIAHQPSAFPQVTTKTAHYQPRTMITLASFASVPTHIPTGLVDLKNSKSKNRVTHNVQERSKLVLTA